MLCVLSQLNVWVALFCLLEWMMGSLREGGSVTVSLWVWCVNVWYPLWDNCRVGPLVVYMMTTPFLVCMGDHSFSPNNHGQAQNVKDPLLLMSLGQDGQPNLQWLHSDIQTL